MHFRFFTDYHFTVHVTIKGFVVAGIEFGTKKNFTHASSKYLSYILFELQDLFERKANSQKRGPCSTVDNFKKSCNN